MSFRYFAEACFHFISTYAQAKSYQVVSAFFLFQAVGLPVARLNASPFRAAVSRALRKLSACAVVRKPSLHSPLTRLPADSVGSDLDAFVHLGQVDPHVVRGVFVHQAASSRDASQR
jgi:hypothetical protein